MTTKKQKTYGLLLDLGGAGGWHYVQGVYGAFHPEIPVPVGGIGVPSLADAKRLDADQGMPLKLVEISEKTVPELRDAAAAARRAETRGEEV